MADKKKSPTKIAEKIAFMDGQIEGLRILLTQALTKTQDKKTLTEISKSLDRVLKETDTRPIASGTGTDNPGVRAYSKGVLDILDTFRKVVSLM